MRLRLTAIGAALLLLALAAPGAVVAAGPSITIAGSPFNPNGDGVRDKVRITVTTPAAATVELRIDDFNGKRVKTITTGATVNGSRTWKWKGRNVKGAKVPFGPYRAKATIRYGGQAYFRSAWITRARRVPYAKRPGAVIVAIDPGHGGPASGAVWKGWPEDRVNLDISLRLEAMLKGAGIGVVMTRRTDRNVSPVGLDLNGDRKYTRLDELIARNDVANQHRADVHLAIHNNASSCHCRRGTEMYTHFGRNWSPEGRVLANALLKEHLWHLDRLPGYRPKSRGVKTHEFKALKAYHPVKMPRPSLQPSVLGESLFLDWPSEHKILITRAGRTAVAAAYFDGVARYLAARPYGLRYQRLSATRTASPGAKASVSLRLTNTGHRTSSSWKLVARVVKQVQRYDGRPRFGDIVARTPIPNGLAPGDSVVVTLPGIPLPNESGRWLVKFDVNLSGGDSLAQHGVVGPQLRVETVAP